MANISNEITALNNSKSIVEQSVYGKNVRGAIATAIKFTGDALVKINNESGVIPDNSISIGKLDNNVKGKLFTVGTATVDGVTSTVLTDNQSPVEHAISFADNGGIAAFDYNDILNGNNIEFLVFKKIDLNTYSDTIDLNSIFIGDDVATSFTRLFLSAQGTGAFENQTQNFPPVRNYDSYNFVYVRTPGLELFISEYDRITWHRYNSSSAWKKLSVVLPKVTSASGSGQATLTVASNNTYNYTYTHADGISDGITIVVDYMDIGDLPAVIFLDVNSFDKTISFSGMKNAAGTAIEKGVINTAATASPRTQFTALAGYAYKITIKRDGTTVTGLSSTVEFLTADVESYYIDA